MPKDGDEIKIEFDIIKTMMLCKEGTHPNLQIVVENWGKKIPKQRKFDLRFWGEEGEPGYAIRFSREQLENIGALIDQALAVPHSRVERRPWWKFWVRR